MGDEAETISRAIEARGYAVVKRPVIDLRTAYDRAVALADAADVSSNACTRVSDFVNRGEVFDRFWRDPVVLAICDRLFVQPYKLGSFHARAVHPGGGPQILHADCPREGGAMTLLGVIWMIDAFREDNGATMLVPRGGDQAAPELALGEPGSFVIYDGSLMHGYGVNRTAEPRRSLQAVYIWRSMRQTTDFRGRLRPETAARLDARARELLDA